MPLPSPLASSTQVDIDRLIDDAEQEGSHLDFKRELPAAWDAAAKQEFLSDVSAFANAGGGDLVFGIDEDGEGRARAVLPQQINPDQETRRLQDFLLNTVEPRIPACEVVAIPVTVTNQKGHVMAIRVPRSWAGPHRVKTNQHFYYREGLRKRQLDVQELRELFLRSEDRGSRLRDFRAERISKILTGDAPCTLSPGTWMVLHLCPAQAVLGPVSIDPSQFLWGASPQPRPIPVFSTLSGNNRVNFDGIVSTIPCHDDIKHLGYSLLFRNSYFEAVKVFNNPHQHHPKYYNFPSQLYESECIKLLKSFRNLLTELELNTEIIALLSVLYADKATFGLDPMKYMQSGQPSRFDRQHILVPDFIIPSDRSPEQGLQPIFNIVWQSCGLPKSMNYKDDGVWAP